MAAGISKVFGMTHDATQTVREFWRLMASNDFGAVRTILSPDFILDWPQTGERIENRDNFAQLNTEYPAHGPWRFTINHILGNADEAVSDVSITDGVQHARAISFFTVADGKITRIVEFWPEPYEPPPGRAHLTTRTK
jgi:ketosteroid isomerase-like protein